MLAEQAVNNPISTASPNNAQRPLMALSRARHKTPRDERACIPDGATRMLHFFGRPLHMIRHSRDAARAE